MKPINIVFPIKYAPSLNVQIRMHWAKKKKMKNDAVVIVKSQTKEKFKGAVSIEYVRHGSRTLDNDNLQSSVKWIQDALVKSGVIEEDNPNVITSHIVRQEKSTRKDARMEVIIKSDNPELINQ